MFASLKKFERGAQKRRRSHWDENAAHHPPSSLALANLRYSPGKRV